MNENGQNEMRRWYRFVAEQQGFVGFALKTMREGNNISAESQQESFGTDEDSFARLQAMTMPRGHSYVDDAYQIATACRLMNPMAFVSAMLLVRGTSTFQTQQATKQYYQAAFDSIADLDDEPEGK